MTLRKICTIMVSVKRIDFFQGVSVAHYIQRKCRCHNASEEHDVRYVDKGRSDTVLRRLVIFFLIQYKYLIRNQVYIGERMFRLPILRIESAHPSLLNSLWDCHRGGREKYLKPTSEHYAVSYESSAIA